MLIDELVNHKMVIDGDHTSTVTFDNILTRLEEYSYPAVSMGHASIVEMGKYTSLGEETNRNERNKNLAQLKRVRNLGGTIAVILEPEGTDRVVQYLQGWHYAHRPLHLRPLIRGLGAGIPCCQRPHGTRRERWLLGSDFNGLAGLPAPRYGSNACNGHPPTGYDATPPSPRPIDVHGQPGVQLPPYTFFGKTYNYDSDGLAHVGLLPDFIQDLIGLTQVPSPRLLNPCSGRRRPISSHGNGLMRRISDNLFEQFSGICGGRQSFDVTDYSANIGPSGTGTNSTTRFYLSSDDVFSNNDIVIGERTVPPCPRITSDAITTVTVPASTVVGDYYLIACADAAQIIVESSEWDNCLTASNKIRVGEPDLVVTAISLTLRPLLLDRMLP